MQLCLEARKHGAGPHPDNMERQSIAEFHHRKASHGSAGLTPRDILCHLQCNSCLALA